MFRHLCPPRPDWRARVEADGLIWSMTPAEDGGPDVPYWVEGVFYEFSSAEIEILESATEELHGMCEQAARHVLDHPELLPRFGLPAESVPLLRQSLAMPSLYGRFDFAYDGSGPPKLLEYNADTPTGLVESAVAQWYWLEDVFPTSDQWNSLHERLIDRWRAVKPRLKPGMLHFAPLGADSEEEWMTVGYLQDTAQQAGIDTDVVAVEDIGWHREWKTFVDTQGRRIRNCFKLYPWEDMLAEQFGAHVMADPADVLWIEPAWKALLSNKALLPVLWELFPEHPNLLPARFDDPGDLDDWVAKPRHGREGRGITINTLPALGDREGGGYVFQRRAELGSYDGMHCVLGSWVVGGAAAGLMVREQAGPITDHRARFVPHVINEPRPDASQIQEWLHE